MSSLHDTVGNNVSDTTTITARRSSPETFIVDGTGISIIGDYDLKPMDKGSFIVAEGVNTIQFQEFVRNNKGKHFRLRNGKLLFELNQSSAHDNVSHEIRIQLESHLFR
jgi:hypothetical protein